MANESIPELLARTDWQKKDFDSLQDFRSFEFNVLSDDDYSLLIDGLNEDQFLAPILYGSLRTIISSRKQETDRKEPFKVYLVGLSNPSELPDCQAYKIHKWHIVEDKNMAESDKYSYCETPTFFIAIRHKWTEAERCVIFLYKKEDSAENPE